MSSAQVVDVACPGGGGAREEELTAAVSGERDDEEKEGRAALGRARFSVA
jgi:hypothetical protein